VVVVVTGVEDRCRSHLHLVVHLLVVIFRVDVANGNITILLVFRRIGMSKNGIDLATEIGLKEMPLRGVGVGIIVNEISLLETAILLVHFMMIVVMRLVHLIEIPTEVDHQVHILHLMGVFVLVVQVQWDRLLQLLWTILDQP